MPTTSKTGLLPGKVKKIIKSENQKGVSIEIPNLVVPAPFTLRPFAGIYNPFPYGCSILCNHPTDFEAKAIVQRAKDAWASEGKSLIDLAEHEALEQYRKQKLQELQLQATDDKKCNDSSEVIFKNYTEFNSRPITPAPTLISGTKASPTLKMRRCFTPDPISFFPAKEKTLLVLDLRRSHSQDAVCWQRETLADYELDVIQDETSRVVSPPVQNSSQSVRRKTPRKKSLASSGTASSLKTQNSKESDSKIQTQQSLTSPSPTRSSIVLDQEKNSSKTPHESDDSSQTSSEDAVIIKRRGKKRKNKKSGKNGLHEGDKEFKGIPDPGETQVSALGTESQDGSSRPSISEEQPVSANHEEVPSTANLVPQLNIENNKLSFLNSDILKQLQRQLDQEVVDSEMNIERKKALEEALRHKPYMKSVQQGEEMKNLKRDFGGTIKNSEEWLSIPRVFTRRSARFELPMDSRMLNGMAPIEYVRNYVFPSPARLVLYNHVFNLYKEEPEDDEETERILLGKNVLHCLGKIMGKPLTSSQVADFQNLIGWSNDDRLDFRIFVGIAATCERLLGPKFCSKMPSQAEDPRNEIERADFESLESKLKRLSPSPKLVQILRSIRDF